MSEVKHTILQVNRKNKFVKLSGRIASEAIEAIIEACNETSSEYKWSVVKEPVPTVIIKCNGEFSEARLEDMIEWLSVILSGSVVRAASDIYTESIKTGKELKFDYDNPYKPEVFMVEFGGDISSDICYEVLVEEKTTVSLDKYFEFGNDSFNLALSYCKDEQDLLMKEHLSNDFMVLTVKYDSGEVAIRSSSGYVMPNGRTGKGDEWMTIEEMLAILETLSKVAKVAQIQFLNITPPVEVINRIMEIFDSRISLISVDSTGFLTLPRGAADFYIDPYRTDGPTEYDHLLDDDDDADYKTQRFLS